MSQTIAELVREYLARNPVALESLRLGIASISRLARAIARETGEAYGYRPSIPAVKMALSRMEKQLSQEEARDRIREIIRILGKTTLTVHDNISVVTGSYESLPRLLQVLPGLLSRSRFVQLLQTFKSYTLIIAEEDAPRVLDAVGRSLSFQEGQSAHILSSPPSIVHTPGVLNWITGYLAAHDINITQIASCHTDTIIVVDSRLSGETYALLHSLIDRSRRASEEEAHILERSSSSAV